MRDENVKLAIYFSVIATTLFIIWAAIELFSVKLPVIGFIVFGIPIICLSLVFWKDVIESFFER